jgi:2-polyprenyl-6-methoxyphenol hydroxylase-like FAD-dependent oxidoreductase
MSPLRAQGINMALRDALVAARLLACAHGPADLDAAAARIEALRRPELERIQALQEQEAHRAGLLSQRPVLRRLLAATAPWCGPLLQQRWRSSQTTLRHGLALPGPLPG